LRLPLWHFDKASKERGRKKGWYEVHIPTATGKYKKMFVQKVRLLDKDKEKYAEKLGLKRVEKNAKKSRRVKRGR
jgi:coenzyme F420-reducing hydrogenase beta subunit